MALEFDLNRDAPAAAHTDCVVVGAFTDNSLTPAGKAIDPLAKLDTAEEIARAREGLRQLIEAYEAPNTRYLSRIAPQFVKTYASDYDHLARVYEWATAAEEGE